MFICSFNRTFMELKFPHTRRTCALHGCFNRTFMELKFHCRISELKIGRFQSYLYGIEICIFFTVQLIMHCFNRTFMELKWRARDSEDVEFEGFNRTFMELKW